MAFNMQKLGLLSKWMLEHSFLSPYLHLVNNRIHIIIGFYMVGTESFWQILCSELLINVIVMIWNDNFSESQAPYLFDGSISSEEDINDASDPNCEALDAVYKAKYSYWIPSVLVGNLLRLTSAICKVNLEL